MIVPKQGYKRRYAFGGSGIFDSVSNIVSGIVASNAAKELAKSALDVGKNIAKTTATDVGSRAVKKLITPKAKKDAIKIDEIVRKLNSGMGIKKF